jgi:DNA-binding FadR family transcriptional regulator
MQEALAKARDTLIADLGGPIADGSWGPGYRLPAERELAERFRTSRVTVREALARLVSLRLVDVRRGSGTVVRAKTEWSFAALPLVLRRLFGRSPAELARLLPDTLALRRALVLHGTTLTLGRLEAGSLDGARSAVARAWASRGDARAFTRADFEMIGEVLGAAELWPALWLLNDLAAMYFELVGGMWAALPIPSDYREAHEAYFAALEAGDVERACAHLGGYLERLDGALLAMLGTGR